MLRATACVVSWSLLACTFGTVGPPARPRPNERIECTDSYGRPITEATIGALVAGYGVYLAAGPECPERAGEEGCDAYAGHMSRGFGSLLLLTGLVFVGGSLVGFSRVTACKQALAARAPAS